MNNLFKAASLALLLLPGVPAAAAGMAGMDMSAPSAALPAGPLVKVDAAQVCMVNNRYMASPQIPIQVGGKTYYGCCEMCKGILASKAEARHAVDPVSGKSVDKAVAVIGKAGDGSVLYFSSLAHLKAYKGTNQK